jgi:hypothetical protein
MLTTKVLNVFKPGQTAKFVLDGVYTIKIRNKYPQNLLFDHNAAIADRTPDFLTGFY